MSCLLTATVLNIIFHNNNNYYCVRLDGMFGMMLQLLLEEHSKAPTPLVLDLLATYEVTKDWTLSVTLS